MTEENERALLLRAAETLVNGDRNVKHGDPAQDFARTAEMWTSYLGHKVHSEDVAAMMVLLKISRISWSAWNRDSWVDVAGYAACGWECYERVKP